MLKAISEDKGDIGSTSLEPLYSISDLRRWSHESESVWRKRIARNEIRSLKFGANRRVPKSALDEFLARRARQ